MDPWIHGRSDYLFICHVCVPFIGNWSQEGYRLFVEERIARISKLGTRFLMFRNVFGFDIVLDLWVLSLQTSLLCILGELAVAVGVGDR